MCVQDQYYDRNVFFIIYAVLSLSLSHCGYTVCPPPAKRIYSIWFCSARSVCKLDIRPAFMAGVKLPADFEWTSAGSVRDDRTLSCESEARVLSFN